MLGSTVGGGGVEAERCNRASMASALLAVRSASANLKGMAWPVSLSKAMRWRRRRLSISSSSAASGFVGILPGLLCGQGGRLLFEAGEFFAQGHFGVNHVFLQNFGLGGRGALGFRLACYGKGMSALAALHPSVGCLQIGYGIMIFRLAAGATEFDGFHVSAIQILMFRPLF